MPEHVFTQAEIDWAKAERRRLCDAHVLAVLRRHGGRRTGKEFQVVYAGVHALRDYMAYPDLRPALDRLEAAGKVTVDRGGSKGPSRWVITLREVRP